MSDVKVVEGTKIEPHEESQYDPAKRGVLLTGTPQQPEVEGQRVVLAYLRCPWCHSIGRSIVSTRAYNWYTCGACGGHFRA